MEDRRAQLRAFIPMMLKYSTGRGKPGWGRPSTRPVWWPDDLPWANVRSDVRTEEEKQRVPWTQALRTIVKNCYKHHGREDLLIEFKEEGIDRGNHQPHHMPSTAHQVTHYSPTMVQTINNPDGTVSIIQVDPGNDDWVDAAAWNTGLKVQTYSQINTAHRWRRRRQCRRSRTLPQATQHGVASTSATTRSHDQRGWPADIVRRGAHPQTRTQVSSRFLSPCTRRW
ncbi:PREDICTED: nuclear respiratory factor 1-like [Priapulus caudatus]|uniref:Nuclear respiratory factor 1-like n=1 Tax=Priapulus caudatus TaxID=37621 RepID=A0ABM1EWX5_PRICU|nr:PREDICTED: nuclear respiratory factor 1-like [Priapulus caudatus]